MTLVGLQCFRVVGWATEVVTVGPNTLEHGSGALQNCKEFQIPEQKKFPPERASGP